MVTPTDRHVGDVLRETRIAKAMTQTDLGAAVGVSFQQIQKYEKGTNRIGMSRLWDIANVLNVPITHFFEGLGANGRAAPTSAISETTLAMATEFDRIPDDAVKVRFLHLARALAKRHRAAG